jgi:uncharacterized protein (DUF2237 family)
MNPCFAAVKENFSIVLKKKKPNKMLLAGKWRNGGDEAGRSTAGALVLCALLCFDFLVQVLR